MRGLDEWLEEGAGWGPPPCFGVPGAGHDAGVGAGMSLGRPRARCRRFPGGGAGRGGCGRLRVPRLCGPLPPASVSLGVALAWHPPPLGLIAGVDARLQGGGAPLVAWMGGRVQPRVRGVLGQVSGRAPPWAWVTCEAVPARGQQRLGQEPPTCQGAPALWPGCGTSHTWGLCRRRAGRRVARSPEVNHPEPHSSASLARGPASAGRPPALLSAGGPRAGAPQPALPEGVLGPGPRGTWHPQSRVQASLTSVLGQAGSSVP